MKFNCIKILMALGYTERGSKCIITRRKKELNLSIEDYTSVSEEDIIKILDSLSKRGIASMIVRMEEFLDQEDYSRDKGDEKVGIDKKSVQFKERDNQKEPKGRSHRIAKEEKGSIRSEKQKKVTEYNLLAIKRDNLAKVSKGKPLPATQKRHGSKKRARFLK